MKSLKSFILKIIPVVLLLAVLALIGLVVVKSRHINPSFSESISKESGDEIESPYCGWYHIYVYTLEDHQVGTLERQAEKHVKEDEYRLALLEINLMNYNEDDISDDALDELDLILSIWAESDKKVILRFLYDTEGNAAATEPDDINIVFSHIRQVAEVANTYASGVYMVQGVFLGDYGEMHDSPLLSNANIISLFNYMDQCFDRSIFLAVRTPAFCRMVNSSASPVNDSTLYTTIGRTALYNDGLLGSETDLGTYAEDSSGEDDLRMKWSRAAEVDYQSLQNLYTPNGGEVVIDNPLNDFENATVSFTMMHISYLDADYDPEVLDKWKETLYEVDGPYYGLTQYEYISRHLGYRFVIRGASLAPPESFFGQTAKLTLRVENVGYSNCYRGLRLVLYATDEETGEGIIIPTNAAPRLWHAGKITRIDAEVPLDRLTEGHKYRVSAALFDSASNEIIRFANETNGTYDCTIGTLSINSALSLAK